MFGLALDGLEFDRRGFVDIINHRSFGLLIAYIIPGFVCLLGAGTSFDAVWVWLVGGGSLGPSVGGVLYVAVASVGAGMTASVVRWAILDTTHEWTGLCRPRLDESRLTERLEAFNYLVEQHYRYYQFYGNSLVAVLAFYGLWRSSPHAVAVSIGWPEAVLVVFIAVFAAGSRDALRKYYTGSVSLLGTLRRRRTRMTNGKHHPTVQSSATKPTGTKATEAKRIMQRSGSPQGSGMSKVGSRSSRS